MTAHGEFVLLRKRIIHYTHPTCVWHLNYPEPKGAVNIRICYH
jgi:hypothetical protein